MKQSPPHSFSLSPVADSLRQPFPEIRLLPDGAFAARDGRPGTLTGGTLNAWTLSQASAARLIAQWRRRETPLVIDYEHQSLNARHNGRPAPAAGWIESLRHAPGEGLFAAVRWTEGAKAFIGQDEYRFISPVFSFNPQTGEVLELKGAALTNVPALDGLGAIAATEAFPGLPGSPEPQQEADMTALNRLKRLLGLPEDAEDGAVQSELDRLESLLVPDEDPLLGAARPTLFDYVQACHPDAALNTLERVNASLREQLSVALTSAQGDRVSRLVEEAVAEGRLSRGLGGHARTAEPRSAGKLSGGGVAPRGADVVPDGRRPRVARLARRLPAFRRGTVRLRAARSQRSRFRGDQRLGARPGKGGPRNRSLPRTPARFGKGAAVSPSCLLSLDGI